MYVHIHRQPVYGGKSAISLNDNWDKTSQTKFYEIHLSLGSYLNDVDTLESSDPAWGLLISIVAQT